MAAFEIICFDENENSIYCTPGANSPSLQLEIKKELTRLPQGRRMLAVEIDGIPQIGVVIRNNNHSLVILHADESDYALFDFITTVDIAYDILHHFITNPYEGITVVDKDAVLRYISPVHERFFGFKPGGAIGQPVENVIENSRLQEVVQTGKAQIGQVQKMRNTSRVVNRIPIHHDGEVVGAIGRVLFRAPEEVHELSRQISSLRAAANYYEKELTQLRHRTFGLEEIIGESESIIKLKEEIRKVAPLDVPIFISGESGTGKELVAHAIHNLSRRTDKAMVIVNCGALPDTLIESELFGYESGAFTGAKREGRAGKFEMADRSTLFLDEVGDLPQEAQVKLLRVLEGSSFERVGSNRQRTVDFRLISATNRDLRRMITEDDYRADLYFRINGVTLTIPPLRDRKEDIPILARNFINKIAKRVGSNVRSITPDAIFLLQSLQWPGNIRQLHHEIQRAIIFANHHELTLDDFADLANENMISYDTAPSHGAEFFPMKNAVVNVELKLIQDALTRFGGNKKRAAEELGISRSYLYKRLSELDSTSSTR